MKFIDLLSNIKVESIDTPFTNIILKQDLENKNIDGLICSINTFINIMNS